MKFSKSLIPRLSLSAFAIALMATFTTYVASAHPYAANVSGTNGSGLVSFVMNEAGANVTIIYEDGSTNSVWDGTGTATKGTNLFLLESPHTGFKIVCFKVGTGTPSLISTDADAMSQWTNGAGFAVNSNPKNGLLFGRLYAANSFTAGGKTQGIYAMNADQTQIAFAGPGIPGTANSWNSTFSSTGNGNFKSPYRIRVAPNNKLLVADGQGANNASGSGARVYLFEADLSSAVALLGPSIATGVGDLFGTCVAFGSLETGDLVLYTASAGEGVPAPSANPDNTNCIRGPLTSPGSFNCVYRYNIGSAPGGLPWTKRPDWAYTVGLDGIAQLRPDVDVATNGLIYAAFGRANLSNPNLQILRPAITTNSPIALALLNNADAINAITTDPTNWLYTSGITPPNNTAAVSDPWNGVNGGGALGMYGGVRRSPDGVFFASLDDDNGLTIANLTNNIPDDGSIFGIANTSSAGLQAGMDWDAADNIWAMCRATLPASAGPQARLRCYSLGLTTTCVTSNDWTGTNGSFQFTLPGALASVSVTKSTGSQNYCNNSVNPGNRLTNAASFNIHLNTSTLAAPVTVAFVRTGGALHGVVNGTVDQPFNTTGNYDMLGDTNHVGAYFTNADGVALSTTNVIFPAGAYPHAGNWQVEVPIYAATNPISGPTFTVAIRLLSGVNYSAVAPVNGSAAVLNTGPQLIQLSAAVPATAQNMNRGIANDNAQFTLTRLGDTNGPGNDAVNPISHTSFTITNINYFGTAANPLDYKAAGQRFDGNILSDTGSSSILIKPGEVTVIGAIGNPVKHTNPSIPPTNLTVVINLTNHYLCPFGYTNTAACTSGICCTNNAASATNSLVSSEGYNYIVNTTTLTLNEFDNANGGEVTLWSNPLKDAADSTNWTVVFANVNLSPSPFLPTVISNYDNSRSTVGAEGFIAAFGKAVSDDSVPASDTMTANGWTSALKLSVNKNPGNAGEAGVNLYPASGTNAGKYFEGNYALRFDMYLSLYNASLPASATANREFAAFGINHRATNANWRLDSNPRAGGNGSFPINADGEWACIDAGINSITPADWDLFINTAFADPIYDTSGTNALGMINTNRQFQPYDNANFFSITPFSNAVQTCIGGCFTGVTNVFGNSGVPNDVVSLNNNAAGGTVANGIIKSPPFGGITNNPNGKSVGGAPVNHWIDISLELKRQTNLTLYAARQAVFTTSITNPPAGTANRLAPVGGIPMLGYLDPNSDLSSPSGVFVYYSNMRLVELSPFIPWTNQTVNLLVTQSQSFTLSNSCILGSNPITNTWFRCTTNGPGASGGSGTNAVRYARDNGTVPTNTWVLSNSVAATSMSATFTTNLNTGTNFISVFTDAAGSVTSFVSVVEVIQGPGNKVVATGSTLSLTVTPTGNNPPTGVQWKRYGTNIPAVQAGKFAVSNQLSIIPANVFTNSVLWISNAVPADSTVYTCTVTTQYDPGFTNAVNAMTVDASGTLVVSNPPTSVVVAPAATNRPWGSPVTFTVSAAGDPPFTYQWKKGGNNIANATDSSFTINAVTGNDAGAGNSYTAGVTNSIGGAVSSAGVLSVAILPYTIGNQNISLSGGIVSMSFTTANSFDTSSAFVLQSCGVVDGTYTNAPGVSITGPTGGPFSITAPQTADQMFYRLNHVP